MGEKIKINLKKGSIIEEGLKNQKDVERKEQLSLEFFDNELGLIRAKECARILSLSVKTIYDWKYRQAKYKVPKNLFVKINQILFIRTDVLKNWLGFV